MLYEQALFKSAIEKNLAQAEVRDLSQFASEAPSPLLRVSVEGKVLYANKSSAPLLAMWACAPGGWVPAAWCESIDIACESEMPVEVEVVCDDRVFSCVLTPIINAGYVNVYGYDVTERRRAEAANARLAAVIKQLAEAIIVTDPEGMIEYVNPGFERITGHRLEEVLGKTLEILRGGHPNAAVYEELWRTVRSGCVWSGRLMNVRKNEELYEEDVTISPVFDASGAIVNLVVIVRQALKNRRANRCVLAERGVVYA